MADISNITLPNGSSAKIKDATARTATQWLDKLNGSKNLLSIYTFERASMYANVQSDGCTVRVHGTGSGVDLTYGTFTVPETGEYSALISIRSGTVTSLYLKTGSEEGLDLKNTTTPTSLGSLTQGTVYELKTWTGTGATVDFTVSILICKTGVLESGLTDFRPPALSNASLTTATIETYDRVCSKNLLQVTKADISSRNSGTWSGNVFTPAGQTGLTMTVSDDGTITTNGAPSAGVYISLTVTLNSILNVGETYVLSGCTGGSASTYGLYTGDQGVWDNFDGGTAKVYTSSITSIYLYVRASANVTGKVFKPMICAKADWDISHDYVPYNTLDGTTLPMAVKKLSDADGQKNLFNYTLESLKALNDASGWVWVNNKVTTGGVTFVINEDNSITLSGTATGLAYIRLAKYIDFNPGEYVLSGCPSGGGQNTYRLYLDGVGTWADYGESSLKTFTTKTVATWITLAVSSGVTTNVTFKPMICKSTDWNISHEYQPFTLDNSLLTRSIGGVIDANYAPISSGSHTGNAQYFFINTNCTYVPANKPVYLVYDYTCGAGALSVQLTDSSGNIIANTRTYTPDGSTTGHISIKVTPSADAYGYNSYHNSTAAVTISNFMIVPAEIFEAGYTHNLPYKGNLLPNIKLTPALIECVDNGKKNLLNEFSLTTGTAGEISVVVNSDRTVTLNTSGATTANSGVRIGYFTGEAGKTYVVSNASTSVGLRVRYGGTTIVLDTFMNASFVAPDSSKAELIWYVPSGTTLTNYLLKPMVCTKAQWDISHEYQPYALPNVKLTPALIECVDSGKKNVLTYTNMTFGNASTITFGSDGSITRTATSTDGRGWTWANRETTVTLPAGTYILCIEVIINGDSHVIGVITEADGLIGSVSGSSTTTFEFTLTSQTDVGFMGKLSASKIKIMLCEKSLWDVSQKYVPYALDNAELTAKEQTNLKTSCFTDTSSNGSFAGLIDHAHVALGITGLETYELSIYTETGDEQLYAICKYKYNTFHYVNVLYNKTITYEACNTQGTIVVSGGTGTYTAKVRIFA